MNRKVLSTSLSLACHTIFLIIAFNLVFTPSSESEPVAPPILIHVHLDYRPFSPSMGNHGLKALQKPPVPAVKMSKMTPMVPYKKPVVSNNHVVAVTKSRLSKTVLSSKEAFKDMKMASRKTTNSSVLPVTKIFNQTQPMLMKQALEPDMQDIQGESPFLPFDQNGAGEDIHAFLGYELYTFEGPFDHVKYFKLSIKVEEIPGSLPALPKDMTFLIDASASMGVEVPSIIAGVEDSVEALGESDKFNVIVFNSQVFKMQEQSVPKTLANLQNTKEFLSNFRAGSTTDLYDTVLKSIDSPRAMKPAYVLLFSDGQPTQGITDSLQLINKIGQVNQGRVPIFGLGAGSVNEYLMNFLTFTNHGWAEFASMDTQSSINAMFSHIKDPVLINLRYYSTGLDRNEMYPKLLPDLFRGSEFVLYGRYTTEDNFLLQLCGDSDSAKQYVIKDSLTNARTGDASIAQEWAMRKVYHLIGQLQFDEDNQSIIGEINRLANKFNLKIPAYK